jgi:hypothetical protein
MTIIILIELIFQTFGIGSSKELFLQLKTKEVAGPAGHIA